jgi:hypothetical protein
MLLPAQIAIGGPANARDIHPFSAARLGYAFSSKKIEKLAELGETAPQAFGAAT